MCLQYEFSENFFELFTITLFSKMSCIYDETKNKKLWLRPKKITEMGLMISFRQPES